MRRKQTQVCSETPFIPNVGAGKSQVVNLCKLVSSLNQEFRVNIQQQVEFVRKLHRASNTRPLCWWSEWTEAGLWHPLEILCKNYSNIKPVRPLAALTGRPVSQILFFYSPPSLKKRYHQAAEKLVSESAITDTAVPCVLEFPGRTAWLQFLIWWPLRRGTDSHLSHKSSKGSCRLRNEGSIVFQRQWILQKAWCIDKVGTK